MKDATPGATPTSQALGPDALSHEAPVQLWQVAVVALIAIVFTAGFMFAYSHLNKWIWLNNWNYVTDHRWIIPLGVMGFSLLVGLAQKYLRAPTVIHGGLVQAMKGEETPNVAAFQGTLLSSFASILSGASLGPEGPIGVLIGEISAWFREKLKIAPELAVPFGVAASASAFNGIIGNPVWTAVFATELNVGGEARLKYIAWNLLSGVIGFAFYTIVGLSAFAGFVSFTPIGSLSAHEEYFLYAILMGLVGAVLAILVGVWMQVMGKVMARAFADRVVERVLAAAVVISIVCVLVPEVMFSGETQIHTIVADPAKYGVGLLLLYAVLKILLLGLSLKSGYIGGPTFPILFTSTMIGLALHQLFTGVPDSILVECTEGAALALALGAPLTAILIVAVIATSSPDQIALIAIAAVVGLIVGSAFKQLVEQRTAAQASAAAPATSAANSPATRALPG
jgi:H+/Cl- antiporter ClcA